jgi:hypothetical protein
MIGDSDYDDDSEDHDDKHHGGCLTMHRNFSLLYVAFSL